MGNTFCDVIYGCAVPHFWYNAKERDIIQELQEACKADLVDLKSRVGWHKTYDQSEDLFWFGVTGGSVQNGFGDIPDVSEDKQAAVNLAWTELPEELRNHLKMPKLQMMVGID